MKTTLTKVQRKDQEQVENGEKVRDPDYHSSALNTVLHPLNNEFEHKCVAEEVRLLNACLIRQLKADRVTGNMYSIPGLPRTKILAHQGWAIWFIVRRWVWDSDMPGVVVADEIGIGKTFTSGAAGMICKLLTAKDVMELPLSILWGNTPGECLNIAQNDYPSIIGEEWKWCLLQRLN